jgi:hypothetical protein
MRAVLNRICAIFCSSAWRLGGRLTGVCAAAHAGTRSAAHTARDAQTVLFIPLNIDPNSSPTILM